MNPKWSVCFTPCVGPENGTNKRLFIDCGGFDSSSEASKRSNVLEICKIAKMPRHSFQGYEKKVLWESFHLSKVYESMVGMCIKD